MMSIERTQIESVKDPNTTHPWFEFVINENARSIVELTVETDNDAEGPDIGGVKADLAQNQNLDEPLAVGHTTEVLEIWEADGEPLGELLSHLAFWYPETDTLEVFEFFER